MTSVVAVGLTGRIGLFPQAPSRCLSVQGRSLSSPGALLPLPSPAFNGYTTYLAINVVFVLIDLILSIIV